jgi:hypothetical protein
LTQILKSKFEPLEKFKKTVNYILFNCVFSIL